ncbi:hypothetical protein PMAYCL1PPCAC_26192, partial [Pristionchus mayeri]
VDYCASKYGAVGIHESLSAEFRKLKATGVKTTLICPYYINTGMFDGVETKSPILMPLQEPEYVVRCILEAVLTNKEEMQIPRFMYFCTAFAAILPTEASRILADYFGVSDTMDTFVGRDTQPNPPMTVKVVPVRETTFTPISLEPVNKAPAEADAIAVKVAPV